MPLKLEVLKAYEDARAMQGGHSFAGYIENVSRDFFATFNEEERQLVLADGAKWPTSALSRAGQAARASQPGDAGPDSRSSIGR